jgi:hypothetical protein
MTATPFSFATVPVLKLATQIREQQARVWFTGPFLVAPVLGQTAALLNISSKL